MKKSVMIYGFMLIVMSTQVYCIESDEATLHREAVGEYLLEAVEEGNPTKTEKALRDGADINYTDKSGKTPLTIDTTQEVKAILAAQSPTKLTTN